MRSLVVCSKGTKAALTLDIDQQRKKVSFGIVKGTAIKRTEGTKRQRGPAVCPYCEQPTSEAELRAAGQAGQMGERMVAVVVEGQGGKDYRPVEDADLHAVKSARADEVEVPGEYIVINGPGASPDAGSHRSINLELYGFTRWGQIFNHRQLLAMDNLVKGLHKAVEEMERTIPDTEYRHALATYLALWIDRVAAFGNTMCRWAAGSQIVKTPFSGQSVPMMWDYPEVNPLANGSGTASTQLQYMLKVIRHEEASAAAWTVPRVIPGSATKMTEVDSGSCYCIVTPSVMLAERTFWEKATAMHVFCRQQRRRGARLSRHWHDLVRLDDAGYAQAALTDRSLALAVARHKSAFFAEKDTTKRRLRARYRWFPPVKLTVRLPTITAECSATACSLTTKRNSKTSSDTAPTSRREPMAMKETHRKHACDLSGR